MRTVLSSYIRYPCPPPPPPSKARQGFAHHVSGEDVGGPAEKVHALDVDVQGEVDDEADAQGQH